MSLCSLSGRDVGRRRVTEDEEFNERTDEYHNG